ncbi:hypothetical protein HMPREF1868_01580 [Olsenella sp. DNF00959]|nr:hypothetical protein HMPREF1868_01580 [Olsenella sp. DNF00959]
MRWHDGTPVQNRTCWCAQCSNLKAFLAKKALLSVISLVCVH